ncbi:MAG: sugar phosphate isomerase/epimerase, partial [Lentisphaeria bacterium]|nr:sugar phosphate isomerase/epimerase [Lentisphaeria bacterium]
MEQYKVGCNTLYPFGRLPANATVFDLDAHKRALEIIASAGGDGCEFSHYQHFDLDQCVQLRAFCAEVGIAPWSAHSWVQLPAQPDDLATSLPGLLTTLRAAGALGAQVMVVHARGFAEADSPEAACALRRDALAQALEKLSPVAQDLGVTIAIENCSNRDDLEFLVATVRELALPSVGFNIDTGHAVLHGMRPEEAIRIMGPNLVTTHMQDNFGKRDDHLPPGLGTIEWPPVLQAIRETGYQGMLMIEISDCPPEREPHPVEDTKAAIAYVRSLLA